jgi:hypothetical protein
MVNFRLPAGRKQHFNNIHAAGHLVLQPLQPQTGYAAQQFPLVFIDAPCRAA